MNFSRAGGILLHPVSLPGKYGIGSLGKVAFNFIDFLKQAQLSYWQILPLSYTGSDNSPYQSYSAFAGNPLLIDYELLIKDGLIEITDLPENALNILDSQIIDYNLVKTINTSILKISFQNFISKSIYRNEYYSFCNQESNWLNTFALFMTIKELNNDAPFWEWSQNLKNKDNDTINEVFNKYSSTIDYYKFVQFIFFKQWMSLKNYANSNKIKIIGDIPIYISLDSADVWNNPENFQLNSDLSPIAVAGVPPDYFSETGQLWGNPLYNWNYLQSNHFKWWKERIAQNLKLYDIIRIDHFRGFESYWAIPANEKTAIKGEWKKAPGHELFIELEKKFGKLPVIAEDLGEISEAVIELRNSFSFPGMKILQFAFNESERNSHQPHFCENNSIVYTGTHDNNTSLGWLNEASEIELENLNNYLLYKENSNVWNLIRLAWSTNAHTAIVPMQDILELDSKARMNTPGTISRNWQWKMTSNMISPEIIDKIIKINKTYNRSFLD